MSSLEDVGELIGARRLSSDDLETIDEDDISSVIRIPVRGAAAAVPVNQVPAPPPLPPKPTFARGINLAAPPPLPPKPDIVRAEKVSDLPRKEALLIPDSDSAVFEAPNLADLGLSPAPALPPTKPLPPLPSVPQPDRKPSIGEDESWVPSYLDERSQIDPPIPPEPTIVSEGDPMRNSVGRDLLDASSPSLSVQVPNLTVPLPAAPYTAAKNQICCLLEQFTIGRDEPDQPPSEIRLSSEAVEDSHIGAIVLSRQRLNSKHIDANALPAPVSWRLYRGASPTGEAWSVLHEYLTNASLKTKGRNRALQLLTGYVVGACLDSAEGGMTMLTEIVRRMSGAERSERDGSIFTLLMNIGAHCSFVQRVSWASVEEVTRRVFSNVIEEMHGKQDDDVMWERALRCYLVLLKSIDCRPCDDISSKCLAALSLHIGDLTHTDVDHVLISDGLCVRLRSNCDDFPTSARVNVRLLEEIGGIETILTLFTDSSSPSARHSLFGIIYDIVVLQCLENVAQDEIPMLNDHIVAFRSLFETHEMADMLIHTFRVGPWNEFVMETITLLLFYPLSEHFVEVFTRKAKESEKGFQEKHESLSIDETRGTGTTERQIRSATARYVASTRALVQMLDKSFCLKVLLQMERMAKQHSSTIARRESMRFGKDWKVLCDMESQLQRYLYTRGGDLSKSLSDILSKIYVSVVNITSGRCNTKCILIMMEIVIEFLTAKPSFTRCINPKSCRPDSVAQSFLNGKIFARRELIKRTDRSIFTLLLLASQSKTGARRMSEARQCLVELLGVCEDPVESLKPFLQDDDATVAYRVQEIVSRYSESSMHPSTPVSITGEAQ